LYNFFEAPHPDLGLRRHIFEVLKLLAIRQTLARTRPQ